MQPELPDVETWERMVRKKVDVYRCPACGHVEQVMRDRPTEEPLVGPLQTRKIINNILVTAFCLATAIHVLMPSRWSGPGWLLLLVLLLIWSALSDTWSGL